MKEERIKELVDMMNILNNYEILASVKDSYSVHYGDGRQIPLVVSCVVYARRTEYSKIICIRYNTEYNMLSKRNYEDETDDYLEFLGIDPCGVITIKQAIVDELMQLGEEKIF